MSDLFVGHWVAALIDSFEEHWGAAVPTYSFAEHWAVVLNLFARHWEAAQTDSFAEHWAAAVLTDSVGSIKQFADRIA